MTIHFLVKRMAPHSNGALEISLSVPLKDQTRICTTETEVVR